MGFLRHFFFTFIHMKQLVSFVVVIITLQPASAQTGNLITNVDFVKDVSCATYKLELSNPDTTLFYSNLRDRDTVKNIPEGLYNAMFYSCDSAYHYGQIIEILENDMRYIYFRNTAYVSENREEDLYSDDYYYDYYDSLYAPVYFGVTYQFGRGFDFDNENPNLLNNFSFDMMLGHDWLVTKPFGIGYEIGYGFTRANYVGEDLEDPTIRHEKQRFTTLDFNFGLLTSIYIKERKFMSIGARYRLPYYARYARINGNDKLTTGGLYRYNDFSVFAQLGYNWGFVFAEYRFNQIFRSPLGDLPNLSIGVRFGYREEF